MRQGQPGRRAKFVQVEPRMSQTGASADEWLAVRPGTEGVVALGLAHVLMREGLRPAAAAGRAGAAVAEWTEGLPSFTPQAVQAITGMPAARLERLAREFGTHAPAVAIIGGAALAHTNGFAQALAVNALNALAGSVGTPGGLHFTPAPQPPADSVRGVKDLLAGTAPQLLLLDEANPVFGAPAAWKAADALRQVPFIVSFGSFVDDTSALADLLLPDHTFLESWTDAAPESGPWRPRRAPRRPAMRPLYDTRPMPDVLLDVVRRLGRAPEPPLPWQTFEEMLQADAPVPAAANADAGAAGTAVAWVEPRFDGEPAAYPFHLLPYASQALGDGSLAHLPWLQELPDPLTTAMWSAWVEIHPQAAARLGIAEETSSRSPRRTARCARRPSSRPGSVPMPLPCRWARDTRRSRGTRAAAAPIRCACWARSRSRRRGPGPGRHARLHRPGGRPGRQPHPLRGRHAQSGPNITAGAEMAHRWGMVVDLDRCTGCEACVTACHAENNIPTVGADEAARGRAMHWIRVERYWEGEFPDVTVKFRPVLCQQCDNAPCEAVCPTYASHQNEDGLNAQVYNRCIGTRYCANACMYNVRFFNFFHPQWEKPLNLQLNPDVSLRESGVMEKCTFCVQRIKAAKTAARAEDRTIEDGSLQPACAQACPAGALVFGDLADPESRVARLSKSPRGSKLLEDLGAEPKITYLQRQGWHEPDA
ncbi:MAG: 4Fe-4S dicluster domain-containing protein [Vicinamibacterales bacterium]